MPKLDAHRDDDPPTRPAKKTAPSVSPSRHDRAAPAVSAFPLPGAPAAAPKDVTADSVFAGKLVFLSKLDGELPAKYVKAGVAALGGTVTASVKTPVDIVLGDPSQLSQKAQALIAAGAAQLSMADVFTAMGEWGRRHPIPKHTSPPDPRLPGRHVPRFVPPQGRNEDGYEDARPVGHDDASSSGTSVEIPIPSKDTLGTTPANYYYNIDPWALPDNMTGCGPFKEELRAPPEVLLAVQVLDTTISVLQYHYLAPSEHSTTRFTMAVTPSGRYMYGVRDGVPCDPAFGKLIFHAFAGR